MAALACALTFTLLLPNAEGQLFKKGAKKKANAKPEAVTAPASCIWKISDADSTVYLAGSVHLLREQDYPIPSAYRAAYEDSDRLVFEVDMKVMEDPEMAGKIRALGMFPDDTTLEDVVKKKTWRMLERYARDRKLPMQNLRKMKPGFVFLTISSVEAVRLGAKADLGLEKTFFDLSKEDVKLSSGLETMEFQLTLFDKLSAVEQDELLRDTLESVDEMAKSLDSMIAAWKVGDGELLDQLMSESLGESENIRKLMLEDRNVNWIPHIEKALAGKQNVFVLVGAGHLVGADSVVAMLRKKGVKVEQLTADSVDVIGAAKAE